MSNTAYFTGKRVVRGHGFDEKAQSVLGPRCGEVLAGVELIIGRSGVGCGVLARSVGTTMIYAVTIDETAVAPAAVFYFADGDVFTLVSVIAALPDDPGL